MTAAGNWEYPETVYQTVKDLHGCETKAILYCHRPERKVLGVSRGKVHFPRWGGASIFSIHEKGTFPAGMEIDGNPLDGMVVAFRAICPNPKNHLATYHILPMEYSDDPMSPGLPPRISPSEERHWFPPPLTFYRGSMIPKCPYLYCEIIAHEISEKEVEEKGWSLMIARKARPQRKLHSFLP